MQVMFFGNAALTIKIDATLLSFSLAPPGGQRRTGKVRSKDLFCRGVCANLKRLITTRKLKEIGLFHVCFTALQGAPSGHGERRRASAK